MPADVTRSAVFVTGGASGLGQSLGRAFAAAGATVFLADINADQLRAASSNIAAETGGRCETIVCDVADAASVDAAVETAWAVTGGLDLAVANAGVVQAGSVLDFTPAQLDWVFGVNVWGVLHVARSYITRARQAGRPGQLLISGSEHSLSNPALSRDHLVHPYTISKHAVFAVADLLQAELRDDPIDVSILCPHAFTSGISQNSAALRPADITHSTGRSAAPTAEARAAMDAIRSTATDVADIAIRGLQRGLFVIPTHPAMRADVEHRYDQIHAGFDNLLEPVAMVEAR